MPSIVRVRCPHCETQFDTGDVGDVKHCWGCERQFPLFPNIVGENDEE